MSISFQLAAGIAIAAFAAAGAQAGHPFQRLHSFCREAQCADGAGPAGTLVQDGSGNLYGATSGGGAYNKGVVFEMRRERNGRYGYKVLYSFCPAGGLCSDGAYPSGSFVLDTSGNIYGLTNGGGSAIGGGVAFELVRPVSGKTWKEQVLYTFCSQSGCSDGYGPTSALAYAGQDQEKAYDGASPLYGSLSSGGYAGYIYQLKPGAGWSYSVIYKFCQDSCNDGYGASGPVAVDSAGDLYGTTYSGGANSEGVVYELSPSGGTWSFSDLHDFCNEEECGDGASPSGVTMDSTGNLFGTTQEGGCHLNCQGRGVAYALAPDGTYTTLHAFCLRGACPDGDQPTTPPVPDGQGNVFGTAPEGGGSNYVNRGAGVVYALTGSRVTVLHKFCETPGCKDGQDPGDGVILGSNGTLFGTTLVGGRYNGGVVYAVMP